MNLNKAMIVGRITQPLELKKMPNGNSVLNFSVATNYNYKNANGEKIEETEFHNIVSFGKQAEVVAQYFVKGQEIFVEGRLKTNSWDDKESGKKMYRTEIILGQFEFGAKPGAMGGNSGAAPAGNYNAAAAAPVAAAASSPTDAPKAGEINYPEENINPEDIPF